MKVDHSAGHSAEYWVVQKVDVLAATTAGRKAGMRAAWKAGCLVASLVAMWVDS